MNIIESLRLDLPDRTHLTILVRRGEQTEHGKWCRILAVIDRRIEEITPRAAIVLFREPFEEIFVAGYNHNHAETLAAMLADRLHGGNGRFEVESIHTGPQYPRGPR